MREVEALQQARKVQLHKILMIVQRVEDYWSMLLVLFFKK